MSSDWIHQMETNITKLWENRSENMQINSSYAYEMNRDIIKYHNAIIPHWRNNTIPTNFPIKLTPNMYSYTDRVGFL